MRWRRAKPAEPLSDEALAEMQRRSDEWRRQQVHGRALEVAVDVVKTTNGSASSIIPLAKQIENYLLGR